MNQYCATCGNPTTKQNDSLCMCREGHENWINPAVASSAFIIKNNAVIYGIRSSEPGKGKLDLPGGFIEVGETAEAAIAREAKEELGLDIKLVDFLGSYATTYLGRPNLNLSFIAEISGGEAIAGDDMAGGEPVWRDIENLAGPSELAHEWFIAAHVDFLKWWRLHSTQPKA